ncbi:GNAT family N-acetyltransferase [Demequina lutea]|uniref:GNAT superfamily N-acetyltransferase n=1 Tax=Demequina lutea TaxID=431489 RepID=A0A7Y9ZFZ6_9MICO|nr:GNAT family N-acetyltransferase [Demequina lutea]NYI42671.1 GNAT superfamily N-acetyltransferase [Demequina lutea]
MTTPPAGEGAGIPPSYVVPSLLRRDHVLEGFRSRSAEQTQWLVGQTVGSHGGGFTRTFVVVESGASDVVAYYAWTMAGLGFEAAPVRAATGGGRHPVPVALLARLAVDERHEGRGLGRALLRDVVARTIDVGSRIGCRGLLVHCETEQAREFYLRHLPSFEPSPSDPMHLVLLIKHLRRAVG